MMKVGSLLTEIQQAIGCPYLSDLHTDRHLLNAQTKTLLLSIPLDRYSLEAWNAAAAYITGKKCECHSIEDVHSLLCGIKVKPASNWW